MKHPVLAGGKGELPATSTGRLCWRLAQNGEATIAPKLQMLHSYRTAVTLRPVESRDVRRVARRFDALHIPQGYTYCGLLSSKRGEAEDLLTNYTVNCQRIAHRELGFWQVAKLMNEQKNQL